MPSPHQPRALLERCHWFCSFCSIIYASTITCSQGTKTSILACTADSWRHFYLWGSVMLMLKGSPSTSVSLSTDSLHWASSSKKDVFRWTVPVNCWCSDSTFRLTPRGHIPCGKTWLSNRHAQSSQGKRGLETSVWTGKELRGALRRSLVRKRAWEHFSYRDSDLTPQEASGTGPAPEGRDPIRRHSYCGAGFSPPPITGASRETWSPLTVGGGAPETDRPA